MKLQETACRTPVADFEVLLDGLGHLGAVCGASALAFAAVLALAAVVAGFAAALAFTVVLPFTGVLGGLVSACVLQSGFGSLDGGLGGAGRCSMCNRGSANQAGESSRQQHCVQLVLHE